MQILFLFLLLISPSFFTGRAIAYDNVHPLEQLEQTTVNLLELRVNKLDLFLKCHRSFERQPEISKKAKGIFEEIWYGECSYDTSLERIIFIIHLGSPLSQRCGNWISKNEYAKALFESLLSMAQKHIHKNLTKDDIAIFCNGSLSENRFSLKDEILFFTWENGKPIYEDAFFE